MFLLGCTDGGRTVETEVDHMNALKLMLAKDKVKFLQGDCPLDEAMRLFTQNGYSAVPVVDGDDTYLGTVCDKDFLRCYAEGDFEERMGGMTLREILDRDWNPPINVYTNVDDVLLLSMNQNFLPVIDDDGIFIGIITRKAIISFLSEQNREMGGFAQLPALSNQHNIEKMMIAIEDETSGYRMFFKMYETAMREVCTRLETINEFLSYKYNRKPLHHLEYRIKSMKSIIGKLEKKNLPLSIASIRENLFDVAGVRAVCAYLNDVYEFANYVEMQQDLKLVRVKDYIKKPKPNGYRSLHLIIEIPVNFLEARQYLPVEIQLRTEPMDYWASLEHDLKYKPVNNDRGIDISKELVECSCELAKTEKKMQNLARLIGCNMDNRDENWQKSWV